MTEYRIFETEQFQEDLQHIARAGRADIVRKLRAMVYPQLASHPYHGANIRKLQGYTPDTWRYRIGSWRFFYEVDDEQKVVLLTAAAHRGSAY
ncbi:MAG TPA: type II toxin-antitoxin system RelE/ParE family toxin [Thermoanaerobaculia bacterium]|nr:type II toxin-antitoxin system RelE/ParE family toxin [Thermoanaerobaculia bacterium]